jgi:hypothetical protein
MASGLAHDPEPARRPAGYEGIRPSAQGPGAMNKLFGIVLASTFALTACDGAEAPAQGSKAAAT